MVEKLHRYEGVYGRFHSIRDWAKQKLEQWKEDHPKGVRGIAMSVIKTDSHSRGPPEQELEETTTNGFPHIHRRKTRCELVRISAAVMGIEFSYAAETAFVSPTLLKIGVQHQHMTMVWGLSPLLGFFITPLLGSLSDGCKLSMGRRRPFILILSLGVLIGLILVPNGEDLGHALGDYYPSRDLNNTVYPSKNFVSAKLLEAPDHGLTDSQYPHPWGIFFTILGTVLLDFDADTCQSPSRAYLLDVCVPEDHARGLSTFTIMAGLGGFFGYAMGGINWDATVVGEYLGGHVRAVFTFITILFIICVVTTVTAFKEIPLNLMQKEKHQKKHKENRKCEGMKIYNIERVTYGSTNEDFKENSFRQSFTKDFDKFQLNGKNGFSEEVAQDLEPSEVPTLKEYLISILLMPSSLRMVCLTNLFCWMSHVCYSLYFTDFVGEAVFEGDPSAQVHSPEYEKYQEGVRFGCWGMSMYSLSCSCYSLIIETLIRRFRAKKVYIGGLLFYSIGMMLMAVIRNKIGVILFSWTAGVMYSTLFTMPYLLVAHYHANGVFELTKEGEAKIETHLRGLGTDVGIVSSMVFLAQFILAMCMGSIVSWAGTTTAVVSVASFLAFCGAISATKVMYLDL